MIFAKLPEHQKGIALTTVGGLALSWDIPLIRLSNGDVWSTLAVRSITTFAVAILVWLTIRKFTNARPPLVPGWIGVAVGGFYALGTMTFLGAVYHTSTANVVFILAFASMFAALLSWIFLNERPARATLVTMAVMVIGVGTIVSAGLTSGHLVGDALALLSALSLAAAITIARASRREMGFVSMAGTIIPACIGFAFVFAGSGSFHIAEPFWIVFNGAVMMPLAFWCLATGPRYLSAPEVGMFYLLETILAPIWVWVIFTETPGTPTLIGGSILILALIGHSIWQMRSRAVAAAPAAA
ncbi:DMT family transporter [Rhizobiaceae bacterium n13]|uniref:DMT family transporter n=1 Tax=Ferirhizobium litorale TaxID=2927786 RepID=A0AAE3QDF2_9HYPH|nr:DMT family transporter [Fererhizobium litorale]MDI7861037.1 DMT family transporter [Fererhizobium litorale]MDI7921184.1 DMT family transporter [Fererhizobium litorale]